MIERVRGSEHMERKYNIELYTAYIYCDRWCWRMVSFATSSPYSLRHAY